MLWVCAAVTASGETSAQDATRPTRQPNAPALSAKLNAYLASAAMTLDPRPRAVLRRIPDRPRFPTPIASTS